MSYNTNVAVVPLGELVSIKGGKRLPKGASLQTKPNEHPYIRVRDMGHRYIPPKGLEYVPKEVFPNIKRYIVHENDVIISIVGTIGLVSIIDSRFHGASQTENAAKLSGCDSTDAHYLYYYLNSGVGQSEIRKGTVGAVQPKLPLYNIEKIPVLWPDRDTRSRITRQLMGLDDKIQLNHRINQTLEQMAQAIFKSWFVDFEPVKAKVAALEAGGNDEDALLAAMAAVSGKTADQLATLSAEQPERYAELRASAELFPSAMQDSELGEIPAGWGVGPLADSCSFQNGYAFKSRDWSESGCPVVKIGSVKPGFVDLQSCSFVSKATVAKLERFKLHTGDILVGMTGYPGETGLVPDYNGEVYLNQRVGRFIPRTPDHKAFVYCLVRTTEFKQYVESQAHGSAQANVSGKAICQYLAAHPPSNILSDFSQIVSTMLEQKIRLHSESMTLSKLRDTLLPKLLSGELTLPDADEAQTTEATA